MADLTQALRDTVHEAYERHTPLEIVGGGSKRFYGRTPQGKPLEVSGHQGIIGYEPTELVITARAGTLLSEIESTLAAQGQMLAFEPPQFGPWATLGGVVACGLAGPRRPYVGAVRDFVLGVKCINGKGEVLSFGGQVMKNVAGFDLFRLMAGAMGTLGVLLEVSLRVLPIPAEELTLVLEMPATQAIQTMNAWAARPLPLSATCHDGKRLWVRLSGSASAVRVAQDRIGGERSDGTALWQSLREHRHRFFEHTAPLWRLGVPPATPPLGLSGSWLIDWGGAQRWLKTDIPGPSLRLAAGAVGGHAMLFQGDDRSGEVFHPLPAPLMEIHRRLKRAIDPRGILNPGRLFKAL
jgi:glycolate oxidase FAD binding subunit